LKNLSVTAHSDDHDESPAVSESLPSIDMHMAEGSVGVKPVKGKSGTSNSKLNG
jgi:hypothetical protein